MERIVLHIDVNSAFLSWSAVKLLEEGYKKDIRNEVAVVAGDPKKRHGIIVAASIPAKKLGIKAPINFYEARRKYKDLIVVKPDYNYYYQKSKAMMDFLKKLFPEFQQYSIDECFIEYTSMKRIYGDEVKFAYKLKNEIYKRFGFTVNVGIGNNKLCAKMASDFEKPNKVHTLYEYEFKDKVWNLDISELFMAGKSSCKKLRELNINTIKDLACADYNMIVRNLKGIGKMLYEYANGIDDSKVENLYEERKGIGYSRTLTDDSDNIEELYSYLYNFAKDISSSLRKKEVYASTLMVTIRNYEFKTVNHQKKYTNSFCLTNDIYEKAKELFNEFWDKEPVRLIGLRATDFTSTNSVQLSMFDKNNDSYKEEQLQKLVDNINSKLGSSSVTLGIKK